MNIKEKITVIKSEGVLEKPYIGRLAIRRKDADIFAFIWITDNGCELRHALFGEVCIKKYDNVDLALFDAKDYIEKHLNRKVLLIPDKETFPLNKWLKR